MDYYEIFDAFYEEVSDIYNVIYDGLSKCKSPQLKKFWEAINNKKNFIELAELNDIDTTNDNPTIDDITDILDFIQQTDQELYFVVLKDLSVICEIDFDEGNGCGGKILDDIVNFINEDAHEMLYD